MLRDDVIGGAKLKIIMLRLSLPDPSNAENTIPISEEYIAAIVDEVEQYILNYCNISAVPADLKFVWINLAVDYIRYLALLLNNSDNGGSIDDNLMSMINSLRMGDTTLGFNANNADPKGIVKNQFIALETVLGAYLMNYTDSLNKFRRVVW